MRRRVFREAATVRLASFSSSLSCIAHAKASLNPHQLGLENGAIIRVGRPGPIRLNGSNRLYLSAYEALRLDVDRPVIALASMSSYIAEYAYQIMLSEDGSQELISFHADRPAATSAIAHAPHLHVGSKLGSGIAENGLPDFHKRHIPTGVVPFSSVIRFLIEELGVEPIRSNWDEILANVLD